MSDTPSGLGFLSYWWKATLIIYFFECIVGYLNGGNSGLANRMTEGLIHAPVLGLFFGGLYWLLRR